MSDLVKVFLSEDEMPRQWYNIQADLPTPLNPPLHPGTGQPAGPDDLAPVFPMNLIEQEMSQERWITIPDEVLDKLLLWRPTRTTSSADSSRETCPSIETVVPSLTRVQRIWT